MKTIWKVQLPLHDVRREVMLPEGFVPLHVNMQKDVPCLWIEVDPRRPVKGVIFQWVGTGHPVPEVGEYLGTVFVYDGSLVFHLYRDLTN